MIIIMNKNAPYDDLYFTSIKQARNYIKFKHPKRNFKEPTENTLVCSFTVMKLVIKELVEYKQLND